jgi:hypothetical protein
MESLIVYPENETQLRIIEAFLIDSKIKFEVNGHYNPKFVKQVLKGSQAKQSGKIGLRIDTNNLWK